MGTLLLDQATPPLDDTTIALDTALPADEVIAFYHQRLPAEGWNEEVMPFHRHGGFAPAGAERPPAMANFDRGEQGPSLRIMCLPAPDDHTTVQIHVAKQTSMNALQQRRRQRMGHDFMQMLPTLAAPLGAAMEHGGGGSAGPDHVDTRATIETDLDVPAVSAHYRAQIERASWEPRGGGESGPVAWSAWAFKDAEGQPWAAFFTALQQPNMPRRYHLYLGADYEGSDEGGPSGRFLGSQVHTGYSTYGMISSR